MRRAFVLLLFAVNTQAANILATYDDGMVGARIDALPYPAALPRELTSGLTNRIHVRISLMAEGGVLVERIVELAIRYDLWDEKFMLVSSVDGAGAVPRALANVAEVDALLRSLPMPKLFDAATLPASRALVLRAQVLLNPIDREKMRMIRKWVARNSTPMLDVNQGASMSNLLFNRIFEEYASDTDAAAAWRFELVSAPFKLDQLSDEKR